jgi:hypothetical protein
MAKFKPILGELSGKLAGNVFSHNTAGAYVRQKQTPTNPNSTRQQFARANLAYVSASWASLTASQRASWYAWAQVNTVTDAFGNAVILTGQQAWCQLNARLKNQGLLTNNTPPATQAMAAPFSGAIGLAGPAAISLGSFGTLSAAYKWECLLAVCPTAGRDPNAKAARWAAISAAGAGGTVALASAVPFTAGQYVNAFIRATDLFGQVGAPIKIRVVAT